MDGFIKMLIFIGMVLSIFLIAILTYKRRIKEESTIGKDIKEEKYLEKEAKKAEKKEKIILPKTK